MPITSPPPPLSRIGLLKGFLSIFLPLCLVFAVVGFLHYYTAHEAERRTLETSETLNVDLARRTIVSDIGGVVSDLLFLSEHIERQGLFEAPAGRRERDIAREFLVFARNKRLYDQIRYLDSSGMEVVRINFNGGKPEIVPRHELQNKANRYYVREAMARRHGDVYVSPLDLNVEGGRIEYPLKPVMRFGTPVFDASGHKVGIVLLNYFGSRLIDDFTRAAANIADHIQLVNDRGFWLSSPNEDDEWGFMFDRDEVFASRFPEAWRRIVAADRGQFQTRNGLFTFATIYPVAVARSAARAGTVDKTAGVRQERFWKIVSRISARELSATLPFFIQKNSTLYLAMFALLSIGTWFLALSRHHHQLATAQRDYEQRFRHTLENIDLAAVALNRHGEVTFCNDYFLTMTSWRRHEVVGKAWIDRFVPADRRGEIEQVIGSMDDPEQFPSHFENQVLTKDGTLRLIAWNNTLSYDAEGRVIGVTGIGEDITEQRRAEEELRKLSQAMEQSPSMVIITNREGLIEYVNPKFTEVSGYRPEEVLGQNPRILKSGETSADEYASLWRTVMSGAEWRGEFHNRKKNGELYWESASISAIRNPRGEITHFLAVKEDITERKRLEQEVEERNRELARSQALAAMGRMASMIAHDLRNPLSSVKMTLQILGRKTGVEEDEEVSELRQIALEQIRYMEEILSDMLTYSRPDALKPEWITIDKVIDLAANLAQRRLDEYGVDLAIHYHPGLPTLYGDATKLRQVFANLISNAAQATDGVAHPRVRIDAMVELGHIGTSIRVDICDNGSGIPEEDQGRLFEPFFTTRAKGTGLGLAIVKRILEQHRATIEMRAGDPGGTCVVVVLPVNPLSDIPGTEATEPTEATET
ncbi:MAG TPA: PAS domain S-box protein [Sedimenticola thiotaurini]|uniref:histidine kinase n=1 Tax=Sedimenticola thiotaurini TaxID=1543721 RepID=A0A831RPX8_9GAMM|nr:PAS domain S-box protein [Sedimenticola thiotaurini]